jgi:hypothetical protein
MGNWLSTHAYIAGWASPAIALVGMLINNSRASTKHVSWSMVMVYVGFLTCMAVVFTPIVDDSARFFAGFCFVFLGGFICVHAASVEDRAA